MPIEKNPLAHQSLVKFHQQKDSLSQSAKQKDSLSQSAKGFKKINNINRYARTLLGVLAASSFATASASASVPALGLASAAYLWPTASASTPAPSSGPSCGITLPCDSQNVKVYLQSSWTNSREACKPQNWPSVTSAVFSNFNAECPDIVDVHPTNKTQILKSIFNKDNCIADDYCKLFYNNIKLHPEASAVVMDMNTDLPSSQPTTADPSSQPTTALPTTASPTTSNPSYVPTTSKPSYIPTSKPSYEPSSAPSTSAPTRFPTASSAPTLLPFSAPTSARPSHSPTSPPSNKALTEEESNPSRAISGGVLGVVVIGAAIGGLKLGIIIQKMYQNNNFVTRFLRRDQDVESATEDVESATENVESGIQPKAAAAPATITESSSDSNIDYLSE